MSETAPAVPADPVPVPMEKPPPKKRGRKPGGQPSTSRKAPSPSLSKLITEALSTAQERVGMSLAALKKALATAGYDVEKNNNRIKSGLKSLVEKGVLVQTRGTGATGSFKLSKKAAPEPAKGKAKKPASSKTKKLALPKDSKSTNGSKKKGKKQRTAGEKKAARGGKKGKGVKAKQQRKSPSKGRPVKRKAGNAKRTQQKINPRKAQLDFIYSCKKC
ncbi:histone H1t [Echinops telfairi]|uniref:Histone H1t n=1 Tax=Echinops telfairi TaxID=9371 RepID=A0ABM0J169_ECHTE|nr:histone H1t [Echinops telfairi]